jgi:hypothetical protein
VSANGASPGHVEERPSRPDPRPVAHASGGQIPQIEEAVRVNAYMNGKFRLRHAENQGIPGRGFALHPGDAGRAPSLLFAANRGA